MGHKPMEFKEGDYIQLVSKYIQISRFKKKLNYKNFGPFKIIKVINIQAYQLKLPENWNIYNMFHMSFLKKICTRCGQQEIIAYTLFYRHTRIRIIGY